MVDARPAVIVAVIVALALSMFLYADGQTVTLKGRLAGTEDARDTGQFVIEADELGAITLNVGQVSYMADYLDGYRNRRVVVTIGPDR